MAYPDLTFSRSRFVAAYASRVRYWVSDRYGTLIERLPSTYFESAIINETNVGEIHRSMQVVMTDGNMFGLREFRDYLVPELMLIRPDGSRETGYLGHYMVGPPATTLGSATYEATVDCKGVTYLLSTSELGAQTFPVGSDTGALIKTICLGAGFIQRQLDIPNTGYTLKEAYVVKPGDKRLTIINDLLLLSSWHPIYMRNDLKVAIKPKGVLESLPAHRSYSTSDPIVEILEDIQGEHDISKMRNRVTVRNLSPPRPEGWEEGDPEPAPIYGTARITNRTNPIYYDPANPTLYFPHEIAGEPIDDSEVATNAEAQAKALIELSKENARGRKVRMRTVVDIYADSYDVIDLDIQRGADTIYTGKWLRDGWTINVRPVVSTMDSELSRIVSIL